jgi:SAM-dependent methyltransferase
MHGDMRALPFSDQSFERVWAYASMHHLEGHDLDTGLRKVVRLLRPGGAVGASLKDGVAGQYLPGSISNRHGVYYTYQPHEVLRARVERAGLGIRKLVAVGGAETLGAAKIGAAVRFQEQLFDSYVELPDSSS